MSKRRRQLHLPAWLPPSRIVGGFFVVRPIGNGSGGSVFVARRSEDRHEEGAEVFALKVPAYTGAAAHTLSEDEFMRLFRDEAGALLTLPRHPNIAGFVTFDAGARPKPILVMELVEGNTLERLVDRRALTIRQVIDVLDGIAAGLQGMHDAGLAHLDIKPANVILRTKRDRTSPPRRPRTEAKQVPVLVDFGLAGRKVRPGCGSPYYGGPEVWDRASFSDVDPCATDVYAFSCLAFELLTGRPLFQGDSLPAILAAHLNHDGRPPELGWMLEHDRHAPLAQLLSAGLAREPGKRIGIGALRSKFLVLAKERLADASWPLRP